MALTDAALALLCGAIVSFALGLTGSGGSIIATPLLLYGTGLAPHIAIGTSAFATSANALLNFATHARAGTVRWASALVFAIAGMLGAMLGSDFGKHYDGRRLLFLLGVLMLGVGALMLQRARAQVRSPATLPPAQDTARELLKLTGAALVTGVVAGFFGVGGGFLTVPVLLLVTGMPAVTAVGTALLAVGCFGMTTAVNYALSGLVNWPVALLYFAGGIVGGLLGTRLAVRLGRGRATLTRLFAGVVFVVACYMLYRNAGSMLG